MSIKFHCSGELLLEQGTCLHLPTYQTNRTGHAESPRTLAGQSLIHILTFPLTLDSVGVTRWDRVSSCELSIGESLAESSEVLVCGAVWVASWAEAVAPFNELGCSLKGSGVVEVRGVVTLGDVFPEEGSDALSPSLVPDKFCESNRRITRINTWTAVKPVLVTTSILLFTAIS